MIPLPAIHAALCCAAENGPRAAVVELGKTGARVVVMPLRDPGPAPQDWVW